LYNHWIVHFDKQLSGDEPARIGKWNFYEFYVTLQGSGTCNCRNLVFMGARANGCNLPS
ncbi:hypothetical protein L7F22_062820, partial [Adiantum nelumboides]|nr:hypothetical protein [Adiantum nelumboides]